MLVKMQLFTFIKIHLMVKLILMIQFDVNLDNLYNNPAYLVFIFFVSLNSEWYDIILLLYTTYTLLLGEWIKFEENAGGKIRNGLSFMEKQQIFGITYKGFTWVTCSEDIAYNLVWAVSRCLLIFSRLKNTKFRRTRAYCVILRIQVIGYAKNERPIIK